MKRKALIMVSIILLLFLAAGCKVDWKSVLPHEESKPELVKVEITFEGGKTLTGYLKDLQLEKDSVVFIGGVTSTNLYDARGNIVGVFNYNRVLFIKVLKEQKPTNEKTKT